MIYIIPIKKRRDRKIQFVFGDHKLDVPDFIVVTLTDDNILRSSVESRAIQFFCPFDTQTLIPSSGLSFDYLSGSEAWHFTFTSSVILKWFLHDGFIYDDALQCTCTSGGVWHPVDIKEVEDR